MDFVTVNRPETGQTVTVAVAPGLRVILEFNPVDAGFAVAGDDFILTLEDGAQVVFQGLISAAQGDSAPTIQIAGIDIGTDVLMEQVLALDTAAAEPIETAAGEDGEAEGEGEEVADGGGSHYVDSFGDLIAGLIKQGIIGETELGFGLIGSGGTELLVEAELLSEGYLLSGGGFSPLGTGLPAGLGGPAPSSSDLGDPGGPGVPAPLPDLAPLVSTDGGDGGDVGVTAYPLFVSDMDIITNQATGNLQIPDELILYLADTKAAAMVSVANASISGPNYDGVNDNAYIWDAPDTALAAPAPFNTWADDGNGHVRFHIGGVGPFFKGSFSYEITDGAGGTGNAGIGVENAASAKNGSYWTLDGAAGDVDEVLLGLDGRNEINGFGGDDIIHGGHDSSGDILRGGDGNDVIFGGGGNDDLQGEAGNDNFIMRAGFSRDDVDGGAGNDTITLDSVLTQAHVDDVNSWLALDIGHSIAGTADGVISLSADASGTIDLGGGDVITFLNIEQIVYTDVV